MVWYEFVWFGMNLYGLVTILKLNVGRGSITQSVGQQVGVEGGHRAARAAKNNFQIHQFAQFKQLFNNLNNSVHIFFTIVQILHTFAHLYNVSYLYNFAQFRPFCTILQILPNFVHLVQYRTFLTILHILHIFENFAHIAQFYTILQSLHNFAHVAQFWTL